MTEILENYKKASKELKKYADSEKKSMDHADFVDFADMLHRGDERGMKQRFSRLDTDPRDQIAMIVKKSIGKQKAEKLFNIKFMEEYGLEVAKECRSDIKSFKQFNDEK